MDLHHIVLIGQLGRTPVYPEGDRICTATPISLSLSRRQRTHRSHIHAGPYLAAKEFRYLRNLIVRSAIDQLLAPDREAQWLFTGIEQWSNLIQRA
jgi:hypothetical protein